MKPFSLEVVLSYRKRLEDVARNRFAEALRAHSMVLRRYEEQQEYLQKLLQERDTIQQEGVEISRLLFMEESISYQEGQLKAMAKTLAEKKTLLKNEQENLLRRSREKQVMEKLKTRQNAAWKTYLNKKEAAMFDEIAVIRHDREHK